jgi:hypothetical protein
MNVEAPKCCVDRITVHRLILGSGRRGKASGKRRRSAGDGKSMASVLIRNGEVGETLGRRLMGGGEERRR